MAHRHPVALCVAVLAALALLAPAGAAQQGGSASDGAWTTPQTPWGHPDLQGVWTTDWERSVPFQRPEDLGERPELTSEEIAARAADEARALADDKDERNTRAGDPEAGPEHWYEFGDHTSPRTSLIVQPANGRMPPKTLGGATRQIDPTSPLGFVGGSMGDGPWNGPEDLHLADRCITRGLPQTWIPSAYNNGFQIVQHPDHVAILYERLHEHRLIPLDDRPALHSGIRTWFGDSRGYWEGDTLVVEVTNFSDRTTFHGAGATRRLVERYTRVNEDTVRVEITIHDPSTWTEPWTLVVNGRHDPDYWQIFEYACHEGNYGMTNILSAARNLEKRAAAEKGEEK